MPSPLFLCPKRLPIFDRLGHQTSYNPKTLQQIQLIGEWQNGGQLRPLMVYAFGPIQRFSVHASSTYFPLAFTL